MPVMNIAFFETLGFEIGRALARSSPHAHPPAAEAPAPRKASRRAAPKAAAARKAAPEAKNLYRVGDHVFYRQGRGKFRGVVVRVSADGRCVVMRDDDGKRVLRPPAKLKRA